MEVKYVYYDISDGVRQKQNGEVNSNEQAVHFSTSHRDVGSFWLRINENSG